MIGEKSGKTKSNRGRKWGAAAIGAGLLLTAGLVTQQLQKRAEHKEMEGPATILPEINGFQESEAHLMKSDMHPMFVLTREAVTKTGSKIRISCPAKEVIQEFKGKPIHTGTLAAEGSAWRQSGFVEMFSETETGPFQSILALGDEDQVRLRGYCSAAAEAFNNDTAMGDSAEWQTLDKLKDGLYAKTMGEKKHVWQFFPDQPMNMAPSEKFAKEMGVDAGIVGRGRGIAMMMGFTTDSVPSDLGPKGMLPRQTKLGWATFDGMKKQTIEMTPNRILVIEKITQSNGRSWSFWHDYDAETRKVSAMIITSHTDHLGRSHGAVVDFPPVYSPGEMVLIGERLQTDRSGMAEKFGVTSAVRPPFVQDVPDTYVYGKQ